MILKQQCENMTMASSSFAPFPELESLVNEPRLPSGLFYTLQLSHIGFSSQAGNKVSAPARRLIQSGS